MILLERRFPKMPHSGLLLSENKTAKVADELLNPRSDGNEIEIRAQVVDFGLNKTFLQSDMSVEAVGARRNVDIDQSTLARLQEIQIEFRGKTNAEINRPETSVACEKIEGQTETLRAKPCSPRPKNRYSPACSAETPLGTGSRRTSSL